MNTPYHIGLAFGLFGAAMLGGALGSKAVAAAPTAHAYELTMEVARTAMRGWELFVTHVPADLQRHGRYTDTDPAMQGRNLWSNGIWPKLDRDGNGHHETLFVVRDGRLVYFGSLGSKGTFVDVAREFSAYKDRSVREFHQAMMKLAQFQAAE